MATDRTASRLSDHVDIFLGHAFKSKDSTTSRYRLRAGDVLVEMDGSHVGRNWVQVHDDDLPLLLVQRVACLRARGTLDQRYLAALISSQGFRDHVNAVTVGSSIPHISGGQIGELELSLPALAEQGRIAEVLSALSDKVASNAAMNRVLLTILEELFRAWFVDFTASPTVQGQAVAPRLTDSARGRVPEGWTWTTISDLAEIVGGGTPHTADPESWDGPHQWVTPRDLTPLVSPVLLATARTITEQGLGRISSGLQPAGTVLISSRAPFGHRAIAEIPVAVNQGCIAMKPAAGVSSLFLLFWVQAAHDEIVAHAKGSTVLEISKSAFRDIPVLRPTAEALAAFEAVARPLYDQVVSNERESRTLRELHRAALPRLVSGELTVRPEDGM
jgi:type I restriction enzyme, S subunit